jgi:pyridinium-3,5-bisthiocarboxylic acid mononucleotide nickel chelatase
MIVRAYLDLWTGLSGDMMVGAILDAGWSEDEMHAVLEQIPIADARVTVESRKQHSLRGTGIRVDAATEPPERPYAEIRKLLASSRLEEPVRSKALELFHRLAVVEGRIHGIDPDRVHFHELGAIDSIVDVVLTIAGLRGLGIEELACGPVPLSRGEIRTAHGKLPVPTPATLLLLEGIPVRWLDLEGEWLTPTGALLLSGLVGRFGPPPEMRLRAVGIGAGTRQSEDRANIVRLLVGEDESPASESIGWVSVLEATIDDLDPRHEAEAVRRLEAAGALDVHRVPIVMKKGRTGTLLRVVCRPDLEQMIGTTILRETSTLGIRIRREFRRELDRWVETVVTPYGPVRIKWSRPDGRQRPMVEFEDVLSLAAAAGVPAREVERAALREADLRSAPASPHPAQPPED